MKLNVFWKLSLKYLWRYKRRYLFLFLALGFAFGVLTVISSLKDGMMENLYLSAQSHYSGDIVALGMDTEINVAQYMPKTEQDAILDAAEKISLDPLSVSVRTSIFGMSKGTIYFNGTAAPLRYLVGLDWEAERGYIEQLSYAVKPDPFGSDSIVLSRPIADELSIQQGDSVTLEVLTASGQKNTGTFVAAGIMEETDFFGYYKVYVSRLTLNRLVGFADDDCSFIGFNLKNRNTIEKKRKELYNQLQGKVNIQPLVFDRNGFAEAKKNLKTGMNILLITLPVYLSEVSELMGAINLASYVLFGMMLAIIMVSAAVTCSLILRERKKESGTMRAIGFYDADTRLVLQMEMALMAFVSMAAGFFIGLLINHLISFGSYSWFPGFEVFMKNGSLAARYQIRTIIVNIMITLCALELAIGGPIYRNSRAPLPEMLSGGAI